MIFCVEDDSNIRELVVYTLESTGFQARGFEDGSSFLEALALETPELVLLDIMLPGEDGMELLRKLKASKKTREIPVIMVTAKGAEYDKVKGLDAGADDYLVKPFAFDELLARLRVMIRRTSDSTSDVFTVADLTADCTARTVKRGGKAVSLSSKEFAILEYMIRNSGVVLSREKISHHIWNYDYEGGSNVVDVYIRYLRKKLDDGFEPKLIHTVRGVGYVLREET
mgnify:CR=1 FL=1